MTTDFDLAERAGVSVEAVRRWLRHRGYGGKRRQRIPPAIEQAFLEAHGAGRGRVEDLPSPPRPRVTRPVARPAPTPRAQAPTIIDREKTRRIADLQRELTQARADLQTAQAELARRPVTRPMTVVEPATAPVVAQAPPADAPSVRDVLARQGLSDERDAIAALQAAVEHGPERLLDALTVVDGAIFERIQPVCAAVVCRQVAGLWRWRVIPTGASRCAVCRGSDNRRWFRLMALRLERAGRKKLLVVGGAPDSHAALKRLQRDAPKLDLRLVEGDQRLDGARARSLVNGVDAVVFWTSSVLDHAVSEPLKDAARRDPRVLRAATPPGGKGVAALCRAVVDALDQQARG